VEVENNMLSISSKKRRGRNQKKRQLL
jgi:hypothetical protein